MHTASQSRDEAAIRVAVTGFLEAWNRHDAKAIANLFTNDGDVVNVVGWWWTGRSQIGKKIAEAHAFIFRESVISHDETHVRFLSPQVAVAHVRWSMVGHKNPDGTAARPRKGVETYVLQKQAEKWFIAAFHNTDSIPEMPLPMGPPKE